LNPNQKSGIKSTFIDLDSSFNENTLGLTTTNPENVPIRELSLVKLVPMNTLLKATNVVPSLMSSANYPCANTKIGLGSIVVP